VLGFIGINLACNSKKNWVFGLVGLLGYCVTLVVWGSDFVKLYIKDGPAILECAVSTSLSYIRHHEWLIHKKLITLFGHLPIRRTWWWTSHLNSPLKILKNQIKTENSRHTRKFQFASKIYLFYKTKAANIIKIFYGNFNLKKLEAVREKRIWIQAIDFNLQRKNENQKNINSFTVFNEIITYKVTSKKVKKNWCFLNSHKSFEFFFYPRTAKKTRAVWSKEMEMLMNK